MKQLAKQFALIFFLGFFALSFALGYGAISGELLDSRPLLFALRAFGVAFVAAGMTLWVATRRDEAGKPELNPLFHFLAGAAMLAVLIAVLINTQEVSTLIAQAGVIMALVGLALAILVTILMPAFPQPVTSSWPEGGEPEATAHGTHDHDEVDKDDDLTRIEGIGLKAQQILKAAGVASYQKLAAMTVAEITSTLKDNGFGAPFNAESWPEQASLAAQGDWDALDALQDKLSGGRRV